MVAPRLRDYAGGMVRASVLASVRRAFGCTPDERPLQASTGGIDRFKTMHLRWRQPCATIRDGLGRTQPE
jgi:hypothetical protein